MICTILLLKSAGLWSIYRTVDSFVSKYVLKAKDNEFGKILQGNGEHGRDWDWLDSYVNETVQAW